MAVRRTNERGEDEIVITATGSQKGDLEPSQICFLSATETDLRLLQGLVRDRHPRPHPRALPGVRASMHAHLKDLILATLDDAPKPAKPPDFVPVDPLGLAPSRRRHPGRLVRRAERLARAGPGHPRAAGRAPADHHLRARRHGQGPQPPRGLLPALRRQLRRGGRPGHGEARRSTSAPSGAPSRPIPGGPSPRPPAPYEVEGDDRSDFREEEEILKEFVKAGHRIFESRLSPFHTGSMSVRGVDAMLYAPKASMPRDVGGPLLSVPLAAAAADDAEVAAPQGHLRGERLPVGHALPRRRRPRPRPGSSIRARRPRPTASSPSTPRGRSSIS